MSVFLLLLGVFATAAGLALVGSGLTVHEGGLDTDVITPGTIAAVGGLLLIGIGLAVRELQRIERALVARPALRPSRPGETAVAAAAEQPDAPVRIPFPPKPKTTPVSQPELAGATTAPPPPVATIGPPPVVTTPPPVANITPPPVATAVTLAEDGAFERLRAKFPTLGRPEDSAVVDGEVPIVTRPPPPVEENVGEMKNTAAAAGGRTNGAAPARPAPRLEAKTRAAAAPERAKASVLNAFWPVGPRRDARPPPAPVAVPVPPPANEPATVRGVADEPHLGAPAAVEPAAAVPVSALKSGVVEGMAYTLYSDGSIEAQLPQGKLRFGSITALRDHIERGA